MDEVEKPVVLLGINLDGIVQAVGLYQSESEAKWAMKKGELLPAGLYWSMVTPAMNTCRGVTIIPKPAYLTS